MVLGMSTKSKRRKALETLPDNLYGSFQGIISRIREYAEACQDELGMQVLMWLHFAHRPLKLVELQHALAVENGDTEFDAENMPTRKVLFDLCLGLAVVDEETLTVRFMHYTLEEYFRKHNQVEFPNGCSSIAKTCLTYLNFGKLRQHCTDYKSLNNHLDKYAFLNYAALYWGTYVKQQSDHDLTKLTEKIVDHESERPPSAIQALYKHLSWGCLSKKFSGIHAAAYFGLSTTMQYLCEMERCNIELQDESDRTPLSWAAEYGHVSIVEMLIKRGDVNINSRDKEYGQTPLSWAAKKGHEAVVRMLTERDDVDINAKDDMYGQTPLIWAAQNGHEAIVRLLIEKDDIDISVKNKCGQSLLAAAAENGHDAVVHFLMRRDDIDINAKDNNGRTPLTMAAEKGHEAVIRLLIEIAVGDCINAQDNNGQTPLSWAAKNGQEHVVRLLIARSDVNINAKDNEGRTPLSWAAENGHNSVVRQLIEGGDIDINAKDNLRQTPLLWAAKNAHEAVVRLLIEKNVNINVKDEYGYTPLTWAAMNGHQAVVRLLIERDDVDINAEDSHANTPVRWAVMNGHEAVVRLLNDRREVLARDSEG